MRPLILGILQQFIGYGISIILFGHGVPTSDRIRGNSFGWFIFSVPILVYLIACAVIASQNISGARVSNSIFNRHTWWVYLAFMLPGLYLAFYLVFETLEGNLKSQDAVLDSLCVLIVPAVSLWSARRFVIKFSAK